MADLLTICQDALAECGFEILTSISGNSDTEARTLLALANRSGNEINKAHEWQQTLTSESSITLVLGVQTYDLPDDMLFYSPETAWNRDTRRPLLLSLTPSEWEYYKGWVFIQGLNLRARIIDKKLEIEQDIATSEVGQQIFFEYRSKNWLTDSVGNGKPKFTADDDIAKFDEFLMSACLRYHIKKQRGLDWQPDYQQFLLELRIHMGNDNGARIARLGGKRQPFIGVNVPDGNYGI